MAESAICVLEEQNRALREAQAALLQNARPRGRVTWHQMATIVAISIALLIRSSVKNNPPSAALRLTSLVILVFRDIKLLQRPRQT